MKYEAGYRIQLDKKNDQYNIYFEVLDHEGNPLSGAQLALTGTQADQRHTDDAGVARFEDVQPGPYTVEITATGHEMHIEEIDENDFDQTDSFL